MSFSGYMGELVTITLLVPIFYKRYRESALQLQSIVWTTDYIVWTTHYIVGTTDYIVWTTDYIVWTISTIKKIKILTAYD